MWPIATNGLGAKVRFLHDVVAIENRACFLGEDAGALLGLLFAGDDGVAEDACCKAVFLAHQDEENEFGTDEVGLVQPRVLLYNDLLRARIVRRLEALEPESLPANVARLFPH